jgi:S-adenosylmethionine hydrolase
LSAITFISDFGPDSHYLASFKGALLQQNLHLPFIQITSRIEPFDIVEAAYLSSMVYKDFGEGSIHVLATNVVATSFKGHLAARFNGHFFVAPDNGILSLIFGESFTDFYRIKTQDYEQKIQNVYLPFLVDLEQNSWELDKVAEKTDQYETKVMPFPVKGDKELRGVVLFVDHFGNAYTNVNKQEFDSFVGSSKYLVQIGKHSTIKQISKNFADVAAGEPLAYFSDHGYLVIAIKQGNAQNLLNLRKYKPILIERL